MDATQMINDSILESDEEENEQENENKRGRPLAKLCILKNEHIPEIELPLFLGDNVLGRDPNTCALPLPAPSISKQHATICISVYRRRGCHSEVDVEALVWDLGSMNGTRKGRLKLTPDVRYALSDGDSLVVADIPCQYVSCAVNTVSSQGDMKTPVSRNLAVKASLPDASGEKGGDTSTGNKKCVNGGAKTSVSLTKTPVRTSCLSFEQTPTQPQGTLVPESDSDSDDERQGKGTRGRKALVSDSDSHKSSPTCSTFLSPTDKIVPESEDESPITPSSCTKNKPYRDVSLSKEKTEVDVGRQQLTKKQGLAIVDDSKEQQRREEERPGGRESDKNGQHDELPVCTPEVSTHAIPAFNMDSDTDMEGEEEGVVSAGAVSLDTNKVSQPPNTDRFHMDSDTDIDEDEDALDKASKTVLSSDESTKPPHVVSVIQPEGITVDSDTDVDDDAAVSDAATKAKLMSFQSAHAADSAPSTQPKDLDSDTDVDEEEESECGKNKSSFKIDTSHTRVDIKSIGPESTPAAPHNLHLDSDTDDEAIHAPAISESLVVIAATESCNTADAGADLDIRPDSDTDVEDDSPLVIPVALTTLSVSPAIMSEALQSDSDADTDVDESSVPPAGDVDNPADLRLDKCTDVENKEADIRETGDGPIPDLCREKTPGVLLPLLQNCSTPVQCSEEEVENMETQAFLSPSSVPFRRVVAPAVALSSCSESQEDEDFVVAETQSFVLQTRDCQGNSPDDHITDPIQAFGLEPSDDEKDEQSSNVGSFKLGLSDSSHLQCQAQALSMESTQAFVPVDRSVNLEDTQAYAAISTADRTSAENAQNLEATQAYGEEEEPARYSVMSETEGQVDLALEATQAYISEPYSDSEDETEKDERKNTTAETQPLDFPTSSSLAMAETQPMSAFEEEESLATDKPVSSVQKVKSRTQNETEESKEHEVSQPQQRPFSEALFIAETQPMHTCDDEESGDEDSSPQTLINSEFSTVEMQPMAAVEAGERDDEDSIANRKRKAKPLQLEEEQTKPFVNSEFSVVETEMHTSIAETQPMATSGNEESDVEDSVPDPQNESTQLEEDKTQTLINSELSAVETQPKDTVEDGESDKEDSIPSSRKRRAKPLQLEETQPLSNSEVSAVETQPMGECEDEESSDDDSILGPRKRKAKPLQLEEEQTQSLSCSEVSAVETQPTVIGEDGESSDEESITGPRKRKAKPLQLEEEQTQPLTNSEVSTVEIQPLDTKTDTQPERVRKRQSEAGTSGVTVRNKRGTLEELKEEEQESKRSAPPKRRTRGKNKALPTNRGRRGKSRPDEDETEEEEQVELPKRGKVKKSIRQQKNDEEEKERLETERKGHAETYSLIKEKPEERVGEENDVAKFRQHERENIEKENRETDKREMERDEIERQQREEQAKFERERKEQERLQAENGERIRLEQERAEKEKKEHEEKERRRKEEKEKLEREKAEREENEKLKREEKEKERKELEEKERLEAEQREVEERLESERKEQEHQASLERGKRQRLEKEMEVKEKQVKVQQENEEEENKLKVPTRRRRAARRTIATQPEQDSTNDDVPARRTRSRSNSSNSVSSERSASSINTQESKGRGRGRGVKRTSEPPQAAIARSSNRRRTVAAVTLQQDSSPQGLRSRSNSSNSLNSEISSRSVSSEIRGGGGRQRGRGRKTEPNPIPPVNSQSDQNSALKPAARGRKSRKVEGSYSEVFQEDKEKADSQQATTTRGQQQTSADGSEPAAADEEDQSNQEGSRASEELPLPKRRGQKAVKSETVETPGTPAVSDGDEAKNKRTGRKRELTENTDEDSSSSTKIFKGEEKVQTTEAAEEKGKVETKDENPAQAKRRGRAPSTQAKKNAKESPPKVEVKEESEKMEVETVQKRARGRPSVAQKKKKEEQEDNSGTSVSSMSQDASVAGSQPQTPTSSVSRKRQTPANSSPAAKTPRSSSASPAASGRLRAASQAYKVLFTGVVDEAGERVLAHLGGSMAKGVADMNCLVTDKVRRTVKFLCAVAKGIPIVTTHWLEKSGKAGSFLSPSAFVVKDPEQEKKFSFSLQESLRIASSQPLLQGYEIHVTKSVKPEPVQMKDIISCSGATFLPKMPSSHKPQTVVISCEEDWLLCGPAVSASLPVVTAEFILTGILQQKLDFQSHTLSAPATNLQATGGKGRGRKKT